VPGAVCGYRPLAAVAVLHRADAHPVLTLQRNALAVVRQIAGPWTEDTNRRGNAVNAAGRRRVGLGQDQALERLQEREIRVEGREGREGEIRAAGQAPFGHVERRGRIVEDLHILGLAVARMIHDLGDHDLLGLQPRQRDKPSTQKNNATNSFHIQLPPWTPVGSDNHSSPAGPLRSRQVTPASLGNRAKSQSR
jgi:hypothetical protein